MYKNINKLINFKLKINLSDKLDVNFLSERINKMVKV